ncbi:MAG: hypothetical protein ABSE90_11550 [Verrucomicrobiota bacterium]|jgi:hypothetical protein
MERIDLKQARSWCRMLLACLLLAGFAPSARAGLFFTGPFAPDNWTQTYDNGNPGSFYFTGSGSATVLTFNAAGTTGESDTIISAVNSGTAQSVSFNWTLTANGNDGSPTAYYYMNGDGHLLSPSGSLSIQIPASATLSFELVGNIPSPGKSPAQLQIMEVVPEAGNALAGLLVLGAAGFEWFRRKRTAGG